MEEYLADLCVSLFDFHGNRSACGISYSGSKERRGKGLILFGSRSVLFRTLDGVSD